MTSNTHNAQPRKLSIKHMPQDKHFAKRLLSWFDKHGRTHLPWQQALNPYRVWVSEIMLQQTQVDTVIPYFERFMQRFPKVEDLGKAPVDEVLHLWTGLGYYARARNLHKCAQQVSDIHNGEFPSDLETLKTLPGIGPSTAAAISSIAFGQADAIMDGNVKRVLTRYLGIAGWPGKKDIENQLWQTARDYMPSERCGDYTQAIMDLGATLCTRSKPRCNDCPMQADCLALKENKVAELPTPKPKKKNPIKACQMLLIYNPSGEIALYKRPSPGIWGGLWSLPEIDLETPAEDHVYQLLSDTSINIETTEPRPVIKHVFSHYTLMIHPVEIKLSKPAHSILENQEQLWYNPHFPQEVGLAAPVKKLLHG